MLILKIVIILLVLGIPLAARAQYMYARINLPDATYQWYMLDSDNWTMSALDSTFAKWKANRVHFLSYDSTRSDGTISRVLGVDSRGKLLVGSPGVSLTAAAIISALSYTPYSAANPAGYISSEVDPVFTASAASSVTAVRIGNWDSAFGWGNHALAGYATSNNVMTFTNKSGNITQWTNNAGYITGVTAADINGALTYTPYPYSNPLNFISAYSPTLGVAGNSIYAAGGNSVAIPAQAFSSLTGKPTTLAGYGITDGYPLSGNPSGFLTAEVDGNPTNEIQAISITGQTVSLSVGGGSFVIPTQTAALTSQQVTTALNYVPLQVEVDGNISNELQSLSLNSGSLQLSLGGGTVTLPTTDLSNYYTKAQSDANYKPITYTPTTAQVTTAIGYIPLQAEVDGSITNELQTLSLTTNSATNGNTLAISGGNSVIIPAPAISLTAGDGIVITGSYPNYTISLAAPSITNNPARSVTTSTSSTGFTISTKPAFVSYFVTCSTTNPLLVGTSAATVFLEYSTNGGSSWASLQPFGSSSGVGVTVTLQLTVGQTGQIVSWIPAGANVRIRYATTGTATVSYVGGQEVTR